VSRIVVTGLGLVTSVGNDLASSWEAICQGKSGVAEIDGYDTSRYRVYFGGQVKNFDPSPYMDRKEIRRADPYEQLAIATSKQALEQAGLEITEETPAILAYILAVVLEACGHYTTDSKSSLKEARIVSAHSWLT